MKFKDMSVKRNHLLPLSMLVMGGVDSRSLWYQKYLGTGRECQLKARMAF